MVQKSFCEALNTDESWWWISDWSKEEKGINLILTKNWEEQAGTNAALLV